MEKQSVSRALIDFLGDIHPLKSARSARSRHRIRKWNSTADIGTMIF